jgi:hypothetical protein
MVLPIVPGTYEQERLALWLEVNRLAEVSAQNAALVATTKDKLEGDTRKDMNALGEKLRRLDNSLLVIKTKAVAYGTTAGIVVSAVVEVLRYWHH